MSGDRRSSFWADIFAAAEGQEIVGVVIRDEDGYDGPDSDDPRSVPTYAVNVVLTAAQAEALLNYSYDAGFGGADCHAIYAWTADRVLFVAEYDGSTRVESVPRHPIDCKPVMS